MRYPPEHRSSDASHVGASPVCCCNDLDPRTPDAAGVPTLRVDKPSDRVNYAPGLLRYSYPPSGQMTANEFYPGGAPAATAWAQASRASSGRMATRSAACAEAALPRTRRPLMPWKIAASRNKLKAR